MGVAIALFTALLAFSKRPRQISDTLLALFLLSLAVPNLLSLTQVQALENLISRYVSFVPLTLGPFMALYARSLTSTKYQLNKTQLYHFLPFFTCIIIAVSSSQYMPFGLPLQPSVQLNPLEGAYMVCLLLSLVGYSIWLEILMKQHRKRVLDYFSQNPNRITLLWLTWAVHFFFIVFVAVHIMRVLSFFDLITIRPDLTAFLIPTSVLFMCTLSYFGIRQSQVFIEPYDGSDEVEAKEATQNSPEVENKSRRLKLQDDQLDGYLSRLEDFITTEKPYLNSELTLGDLATMLDMSKHHLSETINHKLQKNFYNYINEHRINEIKSLLQDPQHASKTITTLAYQVGFNSRSAFNIFFKKTTLMTPTQFRKLHRENNP
jgi:AraC-like DNA-binding protein